LNAPVPPNIAFCLYAVDIEKMPDALGVIAYQPECNLPERRRRG
jgi:hypothetical protein